jgi:hypothetical protein
MIHQNDDPIARSIDWLVARWSDQPSLEDVAG